MVGSIRKESRGVIPRINDFLSHQRSISKRPAERGRGRVAKVANLSVGLNTIPFRHWPERGRRSRGHSRMRQHAANQLPHLTALWSVNLPPVAARLSTKVDACVAGVRAIARAANTLRPPSAKCGRSVPMLCAGANRSVPCASIVCRIERRQCSAP